MIAVTIGIGDGWKQAATRAAARVQEMTELAVHIIDRNDFGAAHPAWLKLKIPEMFPAHDEFFYFDSDILMLRHWLAREMFEAMGRPFMAVPDVNSLPVLRECQAFQLPFPDWYVNSGLFVFGREHRPVLDAAWARHPSYGTWLEQTALNRALIDTRTEVCRLPRTFNTLLWPGVDNYSPEALRARPEIILHAASLGGNADLLRAVQRAAFDSTS